MTTLILSIVASIVTVGPLAFYFGRISKSNNTLKNGFQTFYDSFETIMEAARTLYGQSETLKKIIADETRAVENSSSAIHEISSMVEKTSAGAEGLAGSSRESKTAVDESQQLVTEVNTLLGEVKQSSNDLEGKVTTSLADLARVVDSLKSIQSKTSMINDIVFQTKLLSFNASVEAARAGEAGRGFAVVAEEMSKLAQHSGNASKEIEKILTDSLKETNQLVASVSADLKVLTAKNIGLVTKAQEQSTHVVNRFHTLTDLVGRTSTMSGEISAANKEQEIGVKEVSGALTTLESASNQLTSVAENAFKASFELSTKTENIGKQFVELTTGLGISIKLQTKPFDFKAATAAHIDWKMKLSKYLENPDGSLKPDKVCVDNACALGKWVYGDGMAYKSQFGEVYESLRLSHAEFHKTAAEIIKMIDAGDKTGAAKLLSPSGKYTQISERTVGLISALRAEVEGSATETKAAA